MDHFIEIYSSRADSYHTMIEPEDVDGNLLPALKRVTPLAGKRILDLGSGTGRLPLLLAQGAAQMVCLDLHGAMAAEQWRQRQARGGQWGLLQADMRLLPLASAAFEVVLAGWAMGHFVGWYGSAWQTEMSRVLREVDRVLVPGGAVIIIETLSTGSLTPAAPTEGLARYYNWLEKEWGFARQQVQTDYQFASVEEAVAKTEFFFGSELADLVHANNWARLPEWTGVWGKTGG
jgi:ubiquinone/menaquinone biosynthesis C-methylase UbiE